MAHCMICDRPITAQFVWCAQCEQDMGVAGLPMSQWPENIRAIYRLYDRDRKREKAFREYEIVFSDLGGVFEPEPQAPEPRRTAPDGDYSPGGTLTCVRCKHVFRDTCPTFPLGPTHWDVPTCPQCGCGLLREGGSVRQSRKRARRAADAPVVRDSYGRSTVPT